MQHIDEVTKKSATIKILVIKCKHLIYVYVSTGIIKFENDVFTMTPAFYSSIA